jgi:membrane protease YdiL (CAAX protease family)
MTTGPEFVTFNLRRLNGSFHGFLVRNRTGIYKGGIQMSWLKRHDLGLFFFLAFLLAWWPWPFTLVNPDSVAMIPWSPIIAAFITLGLTRGWVGVKALLKDMTRWRVGIKWYAFALLLPLGVTVAAIYLNVLLGAPAPTAAHFADWYLIFPTFLSTTLVKGAFTEEPGWRGYALPRLLQKYSPLASSLILGVIWFSWHLPLLLTNDSGGQRVPLPYFLSILAMSIVYTWLYRGTKGSVLLVILMHGAFNTFLAFFAPIQFGEAYTRLWWLFTGLWIIVALLVVYRMEFRPLPHREVEQPGPA